MSDKNLQELLSDPATATEIGNALAAEFQVASDPMIMDQRYQCKSGTKTAAGLARTALRIISDLQGWKGE